MTTLIIITSYILSIFLNRYFNKIALKYGSEKIWIMWFIPVLPALVCILGIIIGFSLCKKHTNWFTGKHW